MGGRIDLLITLVAFATAIWLIACSDRDSVSRDNEPLDGPFESAYTGQELADRIQEAIDDMGAYTLGVQESNFVLPQWGGVDGGKVTVGRNGAEVFAYVERTGDGAYAMWLRDGQTYFKRTTCPDLARVPGGGGNVLAPFVFLGNERIKQAKDLKAASGRTALMLTLEGIGEAEISFDPKTFLPNQLSSRTATNNGSPLVWTFGGWQEQPDMGLAAAEFERAYDRGPGGNPC